MVLFLCIYEQVCNSLQTNSKGEGKNKKKDLVELVHQEKKGGKEGDRKREVIRKEIKSHFLLLIIPKNFI